MLKYTVYVIFAFGILSCAYAMAETASGQPEVSINASSKTVKSIFIGIIRSAGYTVKTESATEVTLEKSVQNPIVIALLGIRDDTPANFRVSATFISAGPVTRVVVDLLLIRNAGSAFEYVKSFNKSLDGSHVRMMLNDIKSGLDAGKKPDRVIAETIILMKVRRGELPGPTVVPEPARP